MSTRHLIFPSSFFPSIGGAQGSLLNFIDCIPTEEEVYLAVGIRGYFFARTKERRFSLCAPYYSRLLRFKPMLRLYLLWLRISVKPSLIWLYGGGVLSAQILMNRSWLGINTKFILRSMGEDIQYDAASNYGHDECSAERQLISEAYLMADYCWSLSQEITDLYLDLGIVRAKIYQIGNVVRRPASVPKRAKAKKMRIGVIGRQHAKKNFDLLAQIQPLLTSQAYELHVKIAGSSPEVVCSPDTHYHDASSVTHLRYWPPDDVWEFYAQIDILLILSRVESFGNVTFEAGLAGAHLVMHEDLTGAAIARHLGFAVTTFNDYSATRIVDAIKSIPSQTIPESEPRSAINADEISNMICEVTRE